MVAGVGAAAVAGAADAPKGSSSRTTTRTARRARRRAARCSPVDTSPQHGVVDNVVMPEHKELDPAIPTIGSILRDARLPVELHRQVAPLPSGVARHDRVRVRRLGGQRPPLHGVGRHRRPLRPDHRGQRGVVAARQRDHARPAVVPHRRARQPARRDVVPDRPARLRGRRIPTMCAALDSVLEYAKWKEDDVLPIFDRRLRRGVRRPPAELRRRPARQARRAAAVALGSAARAVGLHRPERHEVVAAPPRLLREAAPDGRREPRHGARRARGDGRVRRHGDHLHVGPRRHVRFARPAVEGAVRLRRDHERARCTCKAPGLTAPGSRTDALGTHVDLAATIASLAGVDPTTQPSLRGVDLSPVLADPATSVRDHVLFAHDTAHTTQINQTRYAIRGFFDGTTKYARYYGVGGGMPGEPGCGARTGRRSCTTSTPRSRTRNTSGTTSTTTRTRSSTSPTTAAAAPSSATTTSA